MTNYAPLVAAWNSTQQPPTGVVGTGLTSTMTTGEKLLDLNAWTITGSIPTSIMVSGTAVLNCVNWAEFNALTAQQQNNVLGLCSTPGLLLGGSTNVGLITPGMLVAYFGSSSTTITALTALAKATPQPWWQANSFSGPLNGNDLLLAGGLS